MMHTTKIRSLSLVLSLCCALQLSAQLTLVVTAIPANTPQGANIHVVGTFNNWAPDDPTKILAPIGNGQYSIVLNPAPGVVKFKFTRGSWASVEGNANGQFLPDRQVNYNGQPQTLTLSILSWEDLGGNGGNSSAAPNVSVMDPDFYIPELNRNRRIWLYLPPDYASSTKQYPVLYMHDGQNLFDNATAPFGEWGVDEALNTLHQQGDYGCIVVGIDHGGVDRLNEYSPWVNPQYGGGQGDEYLNFLVNTLKPYIDANYRTLPGRHSTGIMGSSMGGLISMYGLSERQDVFSKAGVFSPAFWFAGDNSANHVATHPKQGPAKVFFLAGGNEPAYVAQDMQEVASAMTTAGFGSAERISTVPPDGQHSEWFWRREFPAAYQWLFADAVSQTSTADDDDDALRVFPNPAGSWVRFADPERLGSSSVHLQILGTDGKLWRDTTQAASDPIWTGELPAGVYVLKVKRKNGRRWQTLRFTRS
jgi:predicted alpha/beta superfamily hydrolase